MTLNPLDPIQMARAKGVVAKIKERLEEGQLKQRMADLQGAERDIERAYRQTAVDLDKARRELTDAKSSLAERDAELVMQVATLTTTSSKPKYSTATERKAELASRIKTDAAYLAIDARLKEAKGQGTEGVAAATTAEQELKDRELAIADAIKAETVDEETPRYTSENSRKNGAIGLRKTDEEYLALKAAVRAKELALEAAERAFADAKADQRILLREDQRLRDDKAFAAACILAFGDLDAPVFAAASIPTPNPQQPAA